MKVSNTRINPQNWVVKHDNHLENRCHTVSPPHRNKPAWAKPWEEPFIQLIPELNSVKARGNPTEMQRNVLLYAHKCKHTTHKQQCRWVWTELKENNLKLYIVLLLLLSPSFCNTKIQYLTFRGSWGDDSKEEEARHVNISLFALMLFCIPLAPQNLGLFAPSKQYDLSSLILWFIPPLKTNRNINRWVWLLTQSELQK